MTRTRTPLARCIVGVATLAVLTTGCGRVIERATEEAVERAVESESGENVDVDFNDDGISVESDEGDFTLSADEDGVEIDGTDGDGNDFSVNADEDGLEASSDGGGSLDVDADGSFTATDADGEVTSGEVDVDGDSLDFTVEGEDGDSVFTTGEGIPEQWPSDIPQPEGLDEVFSTYVAEGGGENIAITGNTSGSAQDVFDSYTGRLVEAGFDETSMSSQGEEFVTATFTEGDRTVSVTAQSSGGRTDLVVAVTAV